MKAFMSTVLGLVLAANIAHASDFAVAVGVRTNSADAAVSGGPDVSGQMGLGAGVIGWFDLTGALQIRSGFMLNQRNYKTDGTPEVTANITYIDIPATLMYKFADYAGVFGGPVLGLRASDECKIEGGGSCTGEDPDSMLTGFQFGVGFKFAPQMGAELYYEMVPGEFWDDNLKDAKSIGANFLYTFE